MMSRLLARFIVIEKPPSLKAEDHTYQQIKLCVNIMYIMLLSFLNSIKQFSSLLHALLPYKKKNEAHSWIQITAVNIQDRIIILYKLN